VASGYFQCQGEAKNLPGSRLIDGRRRDALDKKGRLSFSAGKEIIVINPVIRYIPRYRRTG
jgi:hypothetical protein